MPLFYRIVQEQWAQSAMDGEGARRYGGRWNLQGHSAVYLAESRALAALEILVHAPREVIYLEWRLIEVEVPDDLIEVVKGTALPKRWRDLPSSIAAQTFGTAWLNSLKNAGLLLPSTIIPDEKTLLLNSAHMGMSRLKIGKPQNFRFDSRLTV